MSHHRSAVGCMPFRPSDLSNCAPWFAAELLEDLARECDARVAAFSGTAA